MCIFIGRQRGFSQTDVGGYANRESVLRFGVDRPGLSNAVGLTNKISSTQHCKTFYILADISDNIAICVFSFYENKNRYNLLNTTDVKALKNELHYSDDRDDELFVGRKIKMKSETGKEKDYIITSLGALYFQGERFINRDLVGDKSEYNAQIIVWVDETK